MTSQIQRASISISSNIAEGSGRNSDKDFAHFLEQSYGSLMEVASVFYLALDDGYVSEVELESLFEDLEVLARRIASLNRSLGVTTSKTPFPPAARRLLSTLDPRLSTNMYFLRRVLFAVPLMLVISAMAFLLVHLAPGGPFDNDRKPASPEVERNIKAKYHLDEPVWKQYGRYLGDLFHGDFGVSLKYRDHTLTVIIAQGLPVSMTLGGLAFCFAISVGLPLGFLTAARHGRWPDHVGSFFCARSLRSEFHHRAGVGSDFCDEVEMVSRRALG